MQLAGLDMASYGRGQDGAAQNKLHPRKNQAEHHSHQGRKHHYTRQPAGNMLSKTLEHLNSYDKPLRGNASKPQARQRPSNMLKTTQLAAYPALPSGQSMKETKKPVRETHDPHNT